MVEEGFGVGFKDCFVTAFLAMTDYINIFTLWIGIKRRPDC